MNSIARFQNLSAFPGAISNAQSTRQQPLSFSGSDSASFQPKIRFGSDSEIKIDSPEAFYSFFKTMTLVYESDKKKVQLEGIHGLLDYLFSDQAAKSLPFEVESYGGNDDIRISFNDERDFHIRIINLFEDKGAYLEIVNNPLGRPIEYFIGEQDAFDKDEYWLEQIKPIKDKLNEFVKKHLAV